MEHTTHLKDFLIILLSSVAVVTLFKSFKISAVLGYLFAGFLIGPKACGFISDISGTRFLGEMGVVFLLFTIGLKMPLNRFQVLQRYVFGLGALQVAVTGSLLAGICLLFGVSGDGALVTGLALSLSSTAVCLQLLSEKGEIARRFGRSSFAVLLFQDLAVVVLLMLITTLQNHDQPLYHILGIAMLKTAIVLLAIIVLGRVLLRPFFRLISNFNNAELFVAVSLLVVLTTSMATAIAGLPMELGAFLAGILLSETEYRHQVEADIQPFYGLFIGLFFMAVGMSIDPVFVYENAAIVLACLAGLIFVKTAILFGLGLLFGIPLTASFRMGLLLAGGGEFVFVVFIPALNANIISPNLTQIAYSVVALSMALTPFLSYIGRRIEDLQEEKESDRHLQTSASENMDLRGHVIIAGFGRVGRIMARLMNEHLIPYVVIENDMQVVANGRANGFPVFYGDARRPEVMRALGAQKAKAAVISLNNPKASVRSAMMLRRGFPNVDVSVRLRNDEYYDKLTTAGVCVVMPEQLEPTLKIAAHVFETMGLSEDEALQSIESFRHHYPNSGQSDADENVIILREEIEPST